MSTLLVHSLLHPPRSIEPPYLIDQSCTMKRGPSSDRHEKAETMPCGSPGQLSLRQNLVRDTQNDGLGQCSPVSSLRSNGNTWVPAATSQHHRECLSLAASSLLFWRTLMNARDYTSAANSFSNTEGSVSVVASYLPAADVFRKCEAAGNAC